MAKKCGDEINRDIRLELITASEKTIEIYESYLLDKSTWRDLALTMTRLRNAMRTSQKLEDRLLREENELL